MSRMDEGQTITVDTTAWLRPHSLCSSAGSRKHFLNDIRVIHLWSKDDFMLGSSSKLFGTDLFTPSTHLPSKNELFFFRCQSSRCWIHIIIMFKRDLIMKRSRTDLHLGRYCRNPSKSPRMSNEASCPWRDSVEQGKNCHQPLEHVSNHALAYQGTIPLIIKCGAWPLLLV